MSHSFAGYFDRLSDLADHLGALKQSNIRWVVEADYIIISDKEECPPCGRSLLI